MEIVTGSQMAKIDQCSINQFGINGLVLMERAGIEASKVAQKMLKEVVGQEVIILAGSGNNGGDGFVMARILTEWGYQVKTYLVGNKDEVKGDAASNLAILDRLNLEVIEILGADELKELESELKQADLAVDALLGTGIKGKPRGVYASLIKLLNSLRLPVLAVDIPSGVEADTAFVLTDAVKAERTVTFALPKLGLLLYPGADYVGQLEVVEIGIPKEAVTEYQAKLLTKRIVRDLLPTRKANSHKGDYSHLLLVAGSVGMTGAAVLAAKATLRLGVGLLTVATPESLNPILEAKLTEAMTYPLSEDGGRLSRTALNELKELAQKRDLLAIGPGLSVTEGISTLISGLLKEVDKPIILDADALNAIKDLEVLKERTAPTVLTPHVGEFARLSGLDIAEIKKDPLKHAKEFAVEHELILVLKDARTIIVNQAGEAYINSTGNSGLATGGSGDVLTGMIGGILAQTANLDAVAVAVYLHGLAADIAIDDLTSYSLLPSDLLDYLSEAIKNITRGD